MADQADAQRMNREAIMEWKWYRAQMRRYPANGMHRRRRIERLRRSQSGHFRADDTRIGS